MDGSHIKPNFWINLMLTVSKGTNEDDILMPHIIHQMDYPHDNAAPIWKANRRRSSAPQGRIPPCIIESSMVGEFTRIPYDTIWNVATRLFEQCPAFWGVAPVARAGLDSGSDKS